MIRSLTNTVGWTLRFAFGAVTALTLLFTLWVGYSAYVPDQPAMAGGHDTAAEQITPVSVRRWWSTKNDLIEQFNTTHLTWRRALNLRTNVPYDALFEEGESQPDPAFADLYATVRAPRVLMSFCEELLLGVARRCQLVDYEGKLGEDGQVDLQGRFHFVPDTAPGTLPELEGGEIQSFRIHLTRVDRIPNNRDMRLRFMARAEQLCETLRARVQNCVISHLYFSPDVRSGSEAQLLEAQVVLAAYTDLSEADQQEVLSSLREQTKSLSP